MQVLSSNDLQTSSRTNVGLRLNARRARASSSVRIVLLARVRNGSVLEVRPRRAPAGTPFIVQVVRQPACTAACGCRPSSGLHPTRYSSSLFVRSLAWRNVLEAAPWVTSDECLFWAGLYRQLKTRSQHLGCARHQGRCRGRHRPSGHPEPMFMPPATKSREHND